MEKWKCDVKITTIQREFDERNLPQVIQRSLGWLWNLDHAL